MNRTVKIWLTCFLLGFGTLGLGQNPDIKRTWHWYFGEGAGLDFSSGTAVADTNGQVFAQETSAVISDTAGNLLFYTDGQTVWDSTHNIMPNGTGIGGCTINSSSQGALIVPQPGNDSLFYIFTTDCAQNNFANGLRYSIVNMNLNGGQGAVITKNNYLFDSVEKLCATHHSNGTDVWIVAHQINTNKYYAYLLTSTSINPVPVISVIGSVDDGANTMGYLKFSPDGKRLVNNNVFYATPYSLELYDFNPSSGVVSNLIALSSDVRFFSHCFSPDNSKLYFGDISTGYLSQFDLCAGDSADIVGSEVQIVIPSAGGDLRMGINDKIYLAQSTMSYIGIINDPNEYGVACNYVNFGVSLNGKTCNETLPNFVESYFFNDTLPCLPNSVQEQSYPEREIALVYPMPASDHINIELQAQQPETAQLRITDLLGRNIHKETFQGKIQVDLTGFTNGMYLTEIMQNGKIQITKIIIKL